MKSSANAGSRGWFKPSGLLDRTFEIGIIAKGLDGLIELIGGVLLLAITPATINRLITVYTRREMSEDPNDVIATHLRHFGATLTGSAVRFTALYLLVHGIVKVVLVIALMRNKMWAYPWLIVVLILFIGYQVYALALKPGAWLIALTVFDALIIWLTWREWRKQLRIRRQALSSWSG
jgi:uncharacterized membrane protein